MSNDGRRTRVTQRQAHRHRGYRERRLGTHSCHFYGTVDDLLILFVLGFRVLVLSTHLEEQYARRCFRAGVLIVT